MSTPNFHSLSGHYFAIEAEDEFELDDTKLNITAELEAQPRIYTENLSEPEDDLRSYPGEAFAGIRLKNEREDIHAECKLIARSGYYSGVNFDYQSMIFNGYDGEYYTLADLEPSDIVELAEGYHGRRITLKQAEATLRRLGRDIATLDKLAGQAIKEFTIPLIKIAQFSNGEAIYRRVTA
jgi:hypothetical protein